MKMLASSNRVIQHTYSSGVVGEETKKSSSYDRDCERHVLSLSPSLMVVPWLVLTLGVCGCRCEIAARASFYSQYQGRDGPLLRAVDYTHARYSST